MQVIEESRSGGRCLACRMVGMTPVSKPQCFVSFRQDCTNRSGRVRVRIRARTDLRSSATNRLENDSLPDLIGADSGRRPEPEVPAPGVARALFHSLLFRIPRTGRYQFMLDSSPSLCNATIFEFGFSRTPAGTRLM